MISALAEWLLVNDHAAQALANHVLIRRANSAVHLDCFMYQLASTKVDDLAHVQTAFDCWREMYNHERPHEAIGIDTPLPNE